MKRYILLFLALSTLFFVFPIPQVEAAWLSDWSYRKSHEIENATDAGINYQVRITVINGSGSDSGETVYLDNLTNADFGDIRFTDDDGSTLLDYWIQDVYNGDNATFWVEVADDLSSSDAEIYVYYGNSGASSISSGDDTFIFFDDFNDQSIDSAKWDVGGGAGTREETADGHLRIQCSSIWGHTRLETDNEYGMNTALMSRVNYTVEAQQTNEVWFARNGSTNHIFYFRDDFSDDLFFYTRQSGGWGLRWQSTTSISLGVWYRHELQVKEGQTRFIWFYDNGTEIENSSFINFDDSGGEIWLGEAYTNDEGRWDYVALRKFVDPEPQHGIWGSQESPSQYITFRWVEAGGQFRVNCTNLANNTEIGYLNGTVLQLIAVCLNESWLFINYTSTYGNSTSNPYNYTVMGNDTITLYFRDPPGEGKGVAAEVNYLFIGVCVFVGLMLVPYLVVRRRRKA